MFTGIVATIGRHQKAETIFMALYTATHQVHLVDDTIALTTITEQLTVATHGNQATTQSLDVVL